MTPPSEIAFEDHADEFVDRLMDELFTSDGQDPDQDQDSGDANSPPNFWLGPINTGPVSFGKLVDDPVTSGSDSAGNGPVGTVDNGPTQ
jgi:hypothetical protein